MAYDPVTGKYTKEDTGVANRMTGLLSRDNEYMQQAETVGKKQANRRGLLNSTMAVSAVEDSRIRAALPIASQEASQAHQSNLTGRQLQMSDIQQGRQIASTEGMQQRDLDTRQSMQQTDIQAQEDRLIRELGSRERLAELEILARRQMQGEQLSHQEQMQLRDLEQARVLATLDSELRERLAAMDLASGDLRAAAGLAQGYENAYSNTVAGIMANPEIPAVERQRYLDHAARVRDSNLALLEQLFNVQLNWGGAGGSGVGTPIAPRSDPRNEIFPGIDFSRPRTQPRQPPIS